MELLTTGRPAPAETAPVEPGRPPAARRRLLTEQALIMGAQAAAGLGNLVFALVAVRLLTPEQFASLVAFLAAYLLLHLPAGSLSAGAALDPELAARTRRRVLLLGGGVGVLLALAAVPLSVLFNLPVMMVLALAATAPGAGLLALARGRLYGEGRRLGVATSLLTEPLVRLAAGLAVAAVAGPVAAAVVIVLAGYAALLVATLAADRGPTSLQPTGPSDASGVAAGTAVGAFLLLAVLQTQDVLLANRLLDPEQAAVFAALSTLGGVAVFATATIPLVLLPRAARDTPAALSTAVFTAAAVGAVLVLAVALLPTGVTTAAFGPAYGEVSELAVPYLSAMALLGVVRVVVAGRCAAGAGRGLLLLLLLGAVAQVAGILVLGSSAQAIALVTLAVSVALALLVGLLIALQASQEQRLLPTLAARVRTPVFAAVLGLSALGLLLRLSVTRSLWLDEATSWRQTQLAFDDLLFDLATTDVHPPLWGVLLWLSVRVLGDGELALRLPSILAGTALVPALYVAGRDLFDRRAGLMAAALGAVSPLAVWYGQEARMYALFMLLATLSLWTVVLAVRTGRVRWWVAFIIVTFALLMTQWFAVLPVAVELIAVLILAVRRRRRRAPVRPLLLGAGGAVAGLALLSLPVLPYLTDQLIAYGNRGAGFAAPSQAGAGVGVATGAPELGIYIPMVNLAWAVGGFHNPSIMTLLVSLWPLLLLLMLGLLGRGRDATTSLLLALIAVPPGVLFAVAQFKPDLFELRYFIGVVPILLLLLAQGASSLLSRNGTVAALGVVLVAASVGALYDQQTGGQNPRQYDFREGVSEINAVAEDGDLLLYAPDYLDNVIGYYGPELEARPLADEDLPPADRPGSVFLLQSFDDRSEVTSAVSDARNGLEQQDRELVAEITVSNVTIWEYR